MTYSYNLNLDGLEVSAVLTYNGSYGLLLCSFDDRAISVRLGSQREYMREDACRALKSRRVMADMVGEAPYSRKATCRAIANRLDLLETQMEVEAGEAERIIAEVKTKWRGLQTAHDFDRFVSTNAIAKQHLALCKRTDNDFENLIAPALAKVLKEDIETDLEIGAPVLSAAQGEAPTVADSMLTLVAEQVKGVLAFHDIAPFESIADGIDVLDEEVADLRGALGESDDLASDRWTALSGVNEVLCYMLDTRGVPTSEHIGENLRAVVEYLSAVEAAVVKWQAAGLAWQAQSEVPAVGSAQAWLDETLTHNPAWQRAATVNLACLPPLEGGRPLPIPLLDLPEPQLTQYLTAQTDEILRELDAEDRLHRRAGLIGDETEEQPTTQVATDFAKQRAFKGSDAEGRRGVYMPLKIGCVVHELPTNTFDLISAKLGDPDFVSKETT